MKDGSKIKVGKLGSLLLYLFVILLPWQARSIVLPIYVNGFFWEYATVSFYMTDILIVGTVFLSLLYADRKKIESKIISLSITTLVATYAVLLTIFSAFSHTSLTGVLILLSAILFAYSIFILPWDKRKMLVAIIIAALWSGTLGIYQFFVQEVNPSTLLGIASQVSGDAGVSVLEVGTLRYLRAYGSLSHPNVLGGLLMVGIFSVLLLFRKTRNHIESSLLVSLLVLFSYSLFLTFSRSAFLGVVFGLLVSLIFILIKGKKIEQKIMIGGIISIAIILISQSIIFSDLVASRFSGNRLETESIEERLDSFTVASSLFIENPIFGSGFNTYTEALAQSDGYRLPAWAYKPVHTLSLLLLVELGMLGSALILFALLVFLKSLYMRVYSWEKAIGSGLLSSLLVVSFFDHYLISSHFGLLLVTLTLFLIIQSENLTLDKIGDNTLR